MTSNTLVIVKRYPLNGDYHFTSMYEMMHSSHVTEYEGKIKLFTYLYTYTEVARLFKFLETADDAKFQLTYLCCNGCDLTKFKSLPNTLRELVCGKNKINNLPDLPRELRELLCSQNKLTELPPLPITLVKLNCDQNLLKSLPYLPEGLETLSCVNNLLEELPKLPRSLKVLNCAHNAIKVLPKLPDSLKILNCSCNGLVVLPKLPSSIELLMCPMNKIKMLPTFPESLIEINCTNNRLIKLPVSIVNSKIKKLNISNNPIFLEITGGYAYHYNANLNKIKDHIKKKAVNRISNWYLEVKYNPSYKFCQNRLQKEFEELYEN